MKNFKYFICFKLIFIFLFSLILSYQGVFAVNKKKPVEVEIISHDGMKLKGTLDVPDYASITNKAPLIIFLHSIKKDRKAWRELPKEIKDSLNVATLNLDLRGHGSSNRNRNNRIVHWQNIRNEDFMKMPDDILEVLKFIKKEYPEINHEKVAIVGASLGSVIGLMAASSALNEVKCMVMFSPALMYKGFDLRLPIVIYGKKPIIFLVNEQDNFFYDSAKNLFEFARGAKHIEKYPFGGHGEDLLRFQPDSGKLVIKWLKDNFLDGKVYTPAEKKQQSENVFRHRKVGEYFGEIKTNRDLYRGIHER